MTLLIKNNTRIIVKFASRIENIIVKRNHSALLCHMEYCNWFSAWHKNICSSHYSLRYSILCRGSLLYMSRRFMMSGDCVSSARAAYFFLRAITHPSILNKPMSVDKPTIFKPMVAYAIDDSQGAAQHKTAVAQHSMPQRFQGTAFYEEYRIQTASSNVTCGLGNTDLRILPEFPAISSLNEHYGEDILNIHANLDSVAVDKKTFAGQQQTHHDFSTTVSIAIKNAWNNANVIGNTSKALHQDQKSGTGMFAHSTSGSIGTLYYDEQGNNIRTMSKTYSMSDLIQYDLDHIRSIRLAMVNDKLPAKLIELTYQAEKVLKNEAKFSLKEVHDNYQHFVWDNIQRDVNYNRNVSFIFVRTMSTHLADEAFLKFKKEFESQLNNQKYYNLDKRGDYRTVMNAMISAYKKTVDPHIGEKIAHLHHEKIADFSPKLLQDIAHILKANAIFLS